MQESMAALKLHQSQHPLVCEPTIATTAWHCFSVGLASLQTTGALTESRSLAYDSLAGNYWSGDRGVTVEATVGATVGATVDVTVEKRVIGYHGGWCDLIVVSLTRAVMYSPHHPTILTRLSKDLTKPSHT
jgi:hypothetical protein